MKAAHARFVQKHENYIDYEISHELPRFGENEHSIVVRITYDTHKQEAYGNAFYEQNGQYTDLNGEFTLTSTEFYQITNHQIIAPDKLAALRAVKGNVTIEDGIATLPCGTQIEL